MFSSLCTRCYSALAVPKQQSLSSARDFIVKVVSRIQSKGETRAYLKHFSKLDSRKFAVLLVEDPLASHDLPGLASSLTALHKCGLYPIVIHAGTGWNASDPITFKTIRQGQPWHSILKENHLLVDTIESLGGRASPLQFGALSIDTIRSHYSLDIDAISTRIALGQLPIVAPLGDSRDGKLVRLNPYFVVKLIADALQPHKIIYVSNEGGVRTTSGQSLPFINLADDYPHLLFRHQLTPKSLRRLSMMPHVLSGLPSSTSATLTSPEGLIDELFTHDGSRTGTLVRPGTAVHLHQTFDELDEDRLTLLLEQAFGRRLDSQYFESVRSKQFWIYLAGDYKGVAILTEEGGIPYMCKLAVSPSGQGQGIADILWNSLTRDHTDMFWRSREDNNANTWYFDHADGSYRVGKWTVFWFGEKGKDMLDFYRNHCRDLPPTFHQRLETTHI